MNEDSFASKPIELECETRRVLLDPRVPDKAVIISQDLSSIEETEMLSFLDKNSDVSHGKPMILQGSVET
jgi:hypothetical protein